MNIKKAFSLTELMIVLLVVSLIVAASIPVLTRKHFKMPSLVEHGAYICYYKDGELYEKQFKSRFGIEFSEDEPGEKVDNCNFNPPKKVAYYHISAIGGGGGGGDSGYTGGSLHSDWTGILEISPFGIDNKGITDEWLEANRIDYANEFKKVVDTTFATNYNNVYGSNLLAKNMRTSGALYAFARGYDSGHGGAANRLILKESYCNNWQQGDCKNMEREEHTAKLVDQYGNDRGDGDFCYNGTFGSRTDDKMTFTCDASSDDVRTVYIQIEEVTGAAKDGTGTDCKLVTTGYHRYSFDEDRFTDEVTHNAKECRAKTGDECTTTKTCKTFETNTIKEYCCQDKSGNVSQCSAIPINADKCATGDGSNSSNYPIVRTREVKVCKEYIDSTVCGQECHNNDPIRENRCTKKWGRDETGSQIIEVTLRGCGTNPNCSSKSYNLDVCTERAGKCDNDDKVYHYGIEYGAYGGLGRSATAIYSITYGDTYLKYDKHDTYKFSEDSYYDSINVQLSYDRQGPNDAQKQGKEYLNGADMPFDNNTYVLKSDYNDNEDVIKKFFGTSEYLYGEEPDERNGKAICLENNKIVLKQKCADSESELKPSGFYNETSGTYAASNANVPSFWSKITKLDTDGSDKYVRAYAHATNAWMGGLGAKRTSGCAKWNNDKKYVADDNECTDTFQWDSELGEDPNYASLKDSYGLVNKIDYHSDENRYHYYNDYLKSSNIIYLRNRAVGKDKVIRYSFLNEITDQPYSDYKGTSLYYTPTKEVLSTLNSGESFNYPNSSSTYTKPKINNKEVTIYARDNNFSNSDLDYELDNYKKENGIHPNVLIDSVIVNNPVFMEKGLLTNIDVATYVLLHNNSKESVKYNDSENNCPKAGTEDKPYCGFEKEGSYRFRYSYDENYMTYGNPGDAGEYKSMVVRSLKDIDTTIHIGRGGLAGRQGTGASGTAGSATYMGSLIRAAGGAGGKGNLIGRNEVLPVYDKDRDDAERFCKGLSSTTTTPSWYTTYLSENALSDGESAKSDFCSNKVEPYQYHIQAGGEDESKPALKGLASNLFNYIVPQLKDKLASFFEQFGKGGKGGGVSNTCWAGQRVTQFEGRFMMEKAVCREGKFKTPIGGDIKNCLTSATELPCSPDDEQAVDADGKETKRGYKVTAATDGVDGALMIRW